MEVVLIRHTSVDVPKGTCYGWSDVPVAETFEHEAAETKAQLAAYTPFEAVFSSPLTRARKLATFCGYAHPEVDDRLKEMYMGDWEMQRYDEACNNGITTICILRQPTVRVFRSYTPAWQLFSTN